MKKVVLIFTISVLCLCSLSSFLYAQQSKEEMAVEASKMWLHLVDENRYAESWEEAAPYFKNAVDLTRWQNSLNSARLPLGKIISRNIKSEQYATSLPGAPDGEYVVIQYESSFENKKSAVETVTPMLTEDGQWRVSGYYIK